MNTGGFANNQHRRKPFRITKAAIAILLMFAAALLFWYPEKALWLGRAFHKDSPGWLVFSFLLILPIVGFPISAVLILSGAKFGFIDGTLLSLVAMPLHILASHGLALSPVGNRLYAWIKKRGYQVPAMQKGNLYLGLLLFCAIPGPPYFLKNYLLAFSGLKLRVYMPLSFPIQFLLALPFVALGASFKAPDPLTIGISISVLALLMLGFRAGISRLKNKISPPH